MDRTCLTRYLVFVHLAYFRDVSWPLCATIGDGFRIQMATVSKPVVINWMRSGKLGTIVSVPSGSECGIQNTMAYDLTKYTFTCDTNNYSMAIKSVSSNDSNSSWTILAVINGTTHKTAPQRVRLCVPVTEVNMRQPTVDRVDVNEGSSETFTCETSASLPPATVTWYIQGPGNQEEIIAENITTSNTTTSEYLTITHSSLTYFPTTQEQNYRIYCKANNMDGQSVFDRKPQLNILYPASLNPLSDQSILEGKGLILPATVKSHGNPRETYAWYHRETQDGLKTFLTNALQLSLGNVSKESAGFYTIEATNQISPTGLLPYTAKVEQTFFLNVFYKTTVSNFTVNGRNGDITVHENETVSFLCTVDGNPVSDIQLYANNFNGVSQLAATTSSDRLHHVLQTASCTDTGIYRCFGQNNYTTTPAAMESRVFVTCTPRPLYVVDANITSYIALNKTVSLDLTVISYPIPPPGRFKWEKINIGGTAVITNNSNTEVVTIGVHTNLTIKRLRLADLGQYKLSIRYKDTKDSYIYTHYFYIAPQEKPQMPTHFTIVKEDITDTTASFKWIPGFDGGLQQTFIVLYKLSSDSSWRTRNVSGSNITLTQLTPNSIYLVKIYANNAQGNSLETTVLDFTTNKSIEVPSSSSSALVGGVVGGILGLVIIIVLVVVIVLQRRKFNRFAESLGRKEEDGTERSNSRRQSQSEDHAYNTLDIGGPDNIDNHGYYNLDRNLYEVLQPDERSAHEYGTLNLAETQSPNCKTYENLQLSPMK